MRKDLLDVMLPTDAFLTVFNSHNYHTFYGVAQIVVSYMTPTDAPSVAAGNAKSKWNYIDLCFSANAYRPALSFVIDSGNKMMKFMLYIFLVSSQHPLRQMRDFELQSMLALWQMFALHMQAEIQMLCCALQRNFFYITIIKWLRC